MKVLALLLLATAVVAKNEDYEGWKSYYIGVATSEKLRAFNKFADDFNIDVLRRPIVQREGVVIVTPDQQEAFIKKLDELEIDYRIHRNDFKKALDFDNEQIERHRNESFSRYGKKSLPYNDYQPLDAIYAYLDEIATKYPETVTLVEPARSFEGRPIKYLKISTTNFEDESKPVIFMDAGIHAREWITMPTVTWAIHKLTEDLTEPDLLEKFDWILLPVVNPDGYEFSRTRYERRWWRKTRSTDSHFLSRLYRGVDGNRNFDFFWNTVGVESSPSSEIYPGSHAFSEVETRVVRDILHEHLHRIALYLSIHSYGSMILYPWGHDGTLSNNFGALHVVGVAMAEEINSMKLPHFPSYVVGNSALVLDYKMSGAAEDYAHSIGVPLAYCIELPGLSDWLDGFELDPKYIEQVCRETWAGIAVGARRAGGFFQLK